MGSIRVYPMAVGADGARTPQLCSPYPLGCLVAYAQALNEGELREHFDFTPITPMTCEEAKAQIDGLAEPGVFLFSSYVWNHEVNLQVARHLKKRLPAALVIFGGPQVPRQRLPLREFFREAACVDVVVRGEGEEALAEVLQTLGRGRASVESLPSCDLSSVPGVTYRNGRLVETPDRERPKSIESFPSPYTAGLFDHWIRGSAYIPLETNRGCPYGCTFCDWGAATLSKIRTMSLERVFQEIKYAATNEIPIVTICDANFGILKRDVEIAKYTIDAHARFGFPQTVIYSAAKTARSELRQIIKLLRDAGLGLCGQLSIQTSDPSVLNIIERSNIKTSEYDKLVEFFHQEGIPGVTDLMIGLPGQTWETCKKDLQFLFDRMLHARVYATSVMPNAPMADAAYREKYAIRVDAQGFVESTFSFTKEDLDRIVDLCRSFKLLANSSTGILKYLLLFLQLDRGVRALDFVEAWLGEVPRYPAKFPASHRLWREVIRYRHDGPGKDHVLIAWDDAAGDAVLGDVDALFREALEICQTAIRVDTGGTDVGAIVTAQKFVLPSRSSRPRTVDLPHDVCAYFAAIRSLVNIGERPASLRPLAEYGPGTLTIEEQRLTLAYDDYGAPFSKLELRSGMTV